AEEELLHLQAHRRLVDSGPVDVAGEAVELGPRVLLVAPDLREPLRAAVDDVDDAGERFDVVDDRRRSEDPPDRRERRLDPRLAALALEALDQPGFLAADVGAGAAVDRQVERVAGSQDILAQESLRVRLFDGALQDPRAEIELAADVDVGRAALDRVRGEDDP